METKNFIARTIPTPTEHNKKTCVLFTPYHQHFFVLRQLLENIIAKTKIFTAIEIDDEPKGTNWLENIRDNTKQANVVIAICSPDPRIQHTNLTVAYEVGLAQGMGKPVLAICDQDYTPPGILSQLHSFKYDHNLLDTDTQHFYGLLKNEVDRILSDNKERLFDVNMTDVCFLEAVSISIGNVSMKSELTRLLSTLDIPYKAASMISTDAATLREQTSKQTKPTLQTSEAALQDNYWNLNLMCTALASKIRYLVTPDVDKFIRERERVNAALPELVKQGFEDQDASAIIGAIGALFDAIPKVKDTFAAFCDISDRFTPDATGDQKFREIAKDFDLYLRKIEDDTKDLRLLILECKGHIFAALCRICGI